MYINVYVKLATGNRVIIRCVNKQWSICRWATLCGRPAYKSRSGQLYRGWDEFQPISNALARRWLKRPEVLAAMIAADF